MRHYRGLLQPLLLSLATRSCAAQDDTLGAGNGLLTLNTTHWNAVLVADAQVLVSLTPAQGGSAFDFLPYDLLGNRSADGQYHWGDITLRWRTADGNGAWNAADSAAARRPVSAAAPESDDLLASADLAATLPSGPLRITRRWTDVEGGDLGLVFTIANTGPAELELGALGFPAEVNNVFTGRDAAGIQRAGALADPYLGLDAGFLRVSPVSGVGPAMVVTPLAFHNTTSTGDGDGGGGGGDGIIITTTGTPFEAYRNLLEPNNDDLAYASQTFEGTYEWTALGAAYADAEWAGAEPWNPGRAVALPANASVSFGLRFSVAPDGVRGIDKAVRKTGTPTALGVPGYVVPAGAPAQLFLSADAAVRDLASEPAGALAVQAIPGRGGAYTVTPAATAFGRVRLLITYADGRAQSVHYHVHRGSALAELGAFLAREQWFDDVADPFGRAPSVLTYDYEARAPVTQEPRVWLAGLSDEGGAGAFLALAAKQAVRPDAGEVGKLERFVDGVLRGTVQRPGDLAVRKSAFFYDPAAAPPGYAYRDDLDWGAWWSWDKHDAYLVDRAYDYVHVAAVYWALYRVARAYPEVATAHAWRWYLDQAYHTIMRAVQPDVGYNADGLMGETVFGEVLADLSREGESGKADNLTQAMRTRAENWDALEVPYGSEQAWDSTGQEGVYYWSNYFGMTATAEKTVDSVLGYTPTVPHWGWNGNARRYWDFIYGGKLQRIERQIHHYGSALNSLVLLSAFRNDPSDAYLLQTGYGGISGPLSNINSEGFASAAFHSFPDTLKWDGYSGDYGPGFLGMILGSGTYVVDHETYGVLAYGGVVQASSNGTVEVEVTSPVDHRVFIGPLGVEITIDAGSIQSFSYAEDTGDISVTVGQLSEGPAAAAVVMWVDTNSDSVAYNVTGSGVSESRMGWEIPLSSDRAVVRLEKS
ncbi:hypothetical protein F4780DRAFT_795821 [Xylariomycetidae sp. FL0641]|nr:hypothetical protein F4780DRAFT_795821 [Xylariomycetidae sp. FL0641]